MANTHRGEVPLTIGGRNLTLKLTLGGLAELEHALGAGDLAGLGERLASGRISARDIIGILSISLKGAGHTLADDEIAALPADGGLGPVIAAIATLFSRTFGEAEAAPVAHPPLP